MAITFPGVISQLMTLPKLLSLVLGLQDGWGFTERVAETMSRTF